MEPTLFVRVVVLAIVIVSVVGVVDGVLEESWDHTALFVVSLALAAALLGRFVVGRRCVGLRADLARWLAIRSELTGEPVDAIADRAVATYRDRVGGTIASSVNLPVGASGEG
jgi:hypothetical protein